MEYPSSSYFSNYFVPNDISYTYETSNTTFFNGTTSMNGMFPMENRLPTANPIVKTLKIIKKSLKMALKFGILKSLNLKIP